MFAGSGAPTILGDCFYGVAFHNAHRRNESLGAVQSDSNRENALLAAYLLPPFHCENC